MQKFQGKYRIDSARAKWWDSGGEGQYFITINSKDFKHIFGIIVNGEMILSEEGKIVAACWNNLPKYYPNIVQDEFCIMPNHVHFTVGVDNSCFDLISVETGFKPVCTNPNENSENINSENKNIIAAPQIKIHGLFEFVKSFKSFSSRGINELNNIKGVSNWHSRFYDNIIRDEPTYSRIKTYIQNNPKVWEQDRFF